MKKFLLILLLPLVVFANDYKSHFFAGGIVAFSKVDAFISGDAYVPGVEGAWDYNQADYAGNGDVHIYGGWEFRPLSWFSLSPAIGAERNGWSWDHSGHKGCMSYFNPYIRLGVGFHIMNVFMEVAGTYGFPIYFWGELDGESTTEDMSQENAWSSMGMFSIGYTIKEHYRVGLTMGENYLESELDGRMTQLHVEMMGLFLTYLF